LKKPHITKGETPLIYRQERSEGELEKSKREGPLGVPTRSRWAPNGHNCDRWGPNDSLLGPPMAVHLMHKKYKKRNKKEIRKKEKEKGKRRKSLQCPYWASLQNYPLSGSE
jgi:hypothetical protein